MSDASDGCERCGKATVACECSGAHLRRCGELAHGMRCVLNVGHAGGCLSVNSKLREVGHGDAVSHPSHYTAGGVECIDALEAIATGFEGKTTAVAIVLTVQCVKYLWRWPLKGCGDLASGLQDLHKAKWYLERLLAHVEGKR